MSEPFVDRNCISFWLPRLKASGVPVPLTEIVHADIDLSILLDGKTPVGVSDFLFRLNAARGRVGGEGSCFLRTGQGSGKHEWSRTCHLPRTANLIDHVVALVEWSALVDFIGLPTKVWAVREFLRLESSFTAFDGFPVNRERRYFFRDGKVVCHHAYWPEGAVAEGNPSVPDWRVQLDALNRESPDEVELLTAMTEKVAKQFDGAWSLDWAMTRAGRWTAIDMAVAAQSFHWPGCPEAEALKTHA